MGATMTAFGEWFASIGAEAATADVAGEAATSGALSSAAGEASAAAAPSLIAGDTQNLFASAFQSLGGALVSGAMAPKPPKIPGVTPMPDPLAQQEARRRSITEQLARRGRASTIMTQPAPSGKLGG